MSTVVLTGCCFESHLASRRRRPTARGFFKTVKNPEKGKFKRAKGPVEPLGDLGGVFGSPFPAPFCPPKLFFNKLLEGVLLAVRLALIALS